MSGTELRRLQQENRTLLLYLEEAHLHVKRYVEEGVTHRVCTSCGADNEPHESHCLVGKAATWVARYKDLLRRRSPRSGRRQLEREG